jgi:hypothetical protein
VRSETFANPSSDPDTRVLVLSQNAVEGRFALVLRPAGPGAAAPVVTQAAAAWGGAEILAWPAGPADVVIANAGRDTAAVDGPARIVTDARMALLRFTEGSIARAVLVDASTCDTGTVPLLRTCGDSVSLVLDRHTVRVERADAAFTVFAPAVTAVVVDGQPVPFTRSGDFVSRGAGTPARTPAHLGVIAYPSPFHRDVTIAVDSPAAAAATALAYDVRGRPVRRLWSGTLAVGRTLVRWDGNDDRGRPVPSGVYFVRVTANGASQVSKIVRVR